MKRKAKVINRAIVWSYPQGMVSNTDVCTLYVQEAIKKS